MTIGLLGERGVTPLTADCESSFFCVCVCLCVPVCVCVCVMGARTSVRWRLLAPRLADCNIVGHTLGVERSNKYTYYLPDTLFQDFAINAPNGA